MVQLFAPANLLGNQMAEASKKEQQHELPIQQVNPSHGDLEVDIRNPIEITLNPEHGNYQRYIQHFDQQKYNLTLNGQEVESHFNKDSNTLTVYGVTLEPLTDYKVDLKVKAEVKGKNQSGNSSFAFEFKTSESYTYAKRLLDKDGNVYEFIGNEAVKEITLDNDSDANFSDLIDLEEKNPIVSSPVKIHVPNEKILPYSYINVNVTYKETPYGLGDYYLEEGNPVLEWLPFSLSEDELTTSFRLKKSVTLIPFQKVEGQETASLVDSIVKGATKLLNAFRETTALADDFNIRKMFNILTNDNSGNFEAELTYLQNIDNSPFENGNPEYYYKIYKLNGTEAKPTKTVGATDLEDDSLLIKKKLENGTYQVKIYEDDVAADDLFWIQDIYIEKAPSLMTQSEISEVAKKYAPITVFQEGEEHFPISFEELFAANIDTIEVGNISSWYDGFHKGKTIPYHHLDDYLSYNGHIDYVINGDNELGLQNVTGSRENATVYYSYIEQDGRKFLNYHMIYAFDPKVRKENGDPGSGAHNLDRESITIELGANNEAINISTSGHLPGQTMGLHNDDYSWTTSRLVMPFEDGTNLFPNYENHPIIPIARGAHAIYPTQGLYDLSVPIVPFYNNKGQEQAGLTEELTEADFQQRPVDNTKGRNIILPNTTDLNSDDFHNYSLKPLSFNQTSHSEHSYLSFSGDWVDVLGSELSSYTNEPFPPFTEKEKFVAEWIDGGDRGFNFNDVPSLNERLREDVELYLSTYLDRANATIVGHVKDAITEEPIQGAKISSLDRHHQLEKLLGQSGADGNYRVQEKAGTEKNILISKSGYMPVEYQGITLEDGEEYYLETILQIPSEYEGRTDGIIKGAAYRADNGSTISGATIKVRKTLNQREGEVLYETTTSADGSFLFENVETGYYTLEISKDGYIKNYINVTAIGGMEVVKQLLLSPNLAEGEMRIVLEWGASPRDLDSHLVGPTNNGGEFHVYYGNKQFYEDGVVHAELDIDDVSSYGPETITIHNIKNGHYRYYVHDYTNGWNTSSTAMSYSSAKVKVFSKGEYREFNVQTNQAGVIWNVFNIQDGKLEPVNTYE